MSSNVPSDALTAQQYLAQERFRRVCPVNGATYCDIGPSAPSEVLVMLCGSAMDSILTSALFDDFCTNKGIRLICVDKPGMGQTPACPLADRVATHTGNTETVLTHLDVRPKALISISSGFIYALHFLAHKGALFEGRPPALFALTPWISFDDAPSLGYTSLAPNWLVSAVPTVMGTFTSPRLMGAFAWSTGVSTAVSTAVRSVGPASAPTLNSDASTGPAQLIRTASQDRLHLAINGSVRSSGMSDEYLLCLGRGPAGFWGYKGYPEVLERIAQSAASGLTQRPRLRVFMGENDGMVPRTAQERFVALFNDTATSSLPAPVRALWDFDHVTFPGGGHNDVATYERCWEAIAAYARPSTS